MKKIVIVSSTVMLLAACSENDLSIVRNNHPKVIEQNVSELSQLTLQPSFSAQTVVWQQLEGDPQELEIKDQQLSIQFAASPKRQTYVFKVNSHDNSQSELHKVIVSPYISGYVIDDPIAGATVRLLSQDGGTEYAQTTTNADGLYRFDNHYDLPSYRILVDAQSGTMDNGQLFEAEMDAQCIHIDERHKCHITPISTLVSEQIDEYAAGRDKSEIVTALSRALNIDLNEDPFVIDPNLGEDSYRVDLGSIRTYIGNGEGLNAWVDIMQEHANAQGDEDPDAEPSDQINDWIISPSTELTFSDDVVKTFDDDAYTPAVTGGNGGEITYQSSDHHIATVDASGKVTIVGTGVATITVTEAASEHYQSQSASFELTVTKGVGQALEAGNAVIKAYGDAAFTQSATAGNGGAVSYSSSNTSVATVNASTGEITIVGVGNTTITATETESANHLGQNDSFTLTVNKGAGEALEAGAHVTKTFGDAAFTQSATRGNGGTVTYSSGNTQVATVNATTGEVTIVGAGTAVITATEVESASYLGQSDSFTLTVNKAAAANGAALEAGANVSKTFGDAAFTQSATGGNGGVVTYSSGNTQVATVNATTGEVTIVGAGTAVITATEAESANYLGQSDSFTLTVNKAAAANGAALEAGVNVSKTFGDAAFTQSATGGNGGVVTYSSSDTNIATVNPSTGQITIVGVGSAIIKATEAESANYLGQDDSFTLTVNKAAGASGAALEAGVDVSKTFGDAAFTQSATGGNGGTVTYSSGNTQVATVNATTGEVTIVGVGSTIIKATEAESANYLGQEASFTLTVNKGAGQTLEAGSDVTKVFGSAAFTQTATGGNGGTVTYSSSDTSIATVNANTGEVTIVGPGTVTITATEASTNNYLQQSDSYQLKIASEAISSVSSTYSSSGGFVGAFAALRQDGSIVTWGDSVMGGNSDTVTGEINGTNPVVQIQSTTGAFAALRQDGSVVTWGENSVGGDSTSVASDIDGTNPVVRLFSGNNAFAALRQDGSVVSWGNASFGGDSSSVAGEINCTNPVVHIYSNQMAFAAIRQDGSVVTWGSSSFGGDSTSVANELDGANRVIQVYGNGLAFAALRVDGSVVTWGGSGAGGNSDSVAQQINGNVKRVFASMQAFVALRDDGSIVSWGNDFTGADSSGVAHEIDSNNRVVKIVSNDFAFAAIREDGSVFSWGNASYGGDSSSIADEINGTNPVVQIYSTAMAFAALRQDGSVVTWGSASEGGSYTGLDLDGTNRVIHIYATQGAFAALRQDGSVISWGDSSDGGRYYGSELDGTNPVVHIHSAKRAFAALRQDGSLVTWGSSTSGGDSSSVANQLAGGYLNDNTALDTDKDGFSNIDELASCQVPYTVIGQHPCVSSGLWDTDGDGINDKFEVDNQLNPLKSNQHEQPMDANRDYQPDHFVLPQFVEFERPVYHEV